MEVEDINVSFGCKHILKDVCFKAEEKGFTGIIGPNGCGKSTFLKTIYRYIEPDSGKILIKGEDILLKKPKDLFKTMAVVGQFNQINFNFTVYDIVAMGRSPHKRVLEKDTKADKEIILDSLKKTGMVSYAHRDFLELSGGEKQRVILSRALAQEPEILILDEPTNHLDIRYQIEILEIVKSLDICVIAVLHDLSLTYKYCDYIYVMEKGEIKNRGKTEDIITEDLIKKLYNIDSKILVDNEDIAICYKL